MGLIRLTTEKWSALLSLGVAITVLVAAYFQWWDITYNGGMRTRPWVKVLFAVLIVVLLIAGILLLA